jgi:Zn-dependent protease with chaperone function
MFAARGIAVSLSVFVMVYCILSLAVCLAWRTVQSRIERLPVRRVADLLFALRMFPLAIAAVITVAFTVPSFLLLEPRAIEEPLGEIPLVLGIFGTVLGVFGIVNAGMALRRASRTISTWTNAAQPVDSGAPIPVLRIPPAVPAMTATGIVRPKVWLSAAAESMLTVNELHTALNHEVAHVQRRDNLKKLLLRVVAFPGMAGLEAAWLEATEMAADDAAVSNAGEALDLASALIKLSRLGPVQPPPELTTALVHSPASSMNARVERLIAWSDDRLALPRRFSPRYGLGAALATLVVFALTYTQLLVHVHTATEWLVR